MPDLQPAAPEPAALDAGPLGRRALRFLVVRASGVLVNQLGLMLLHGGWRWPLPVASALAVEASILSNFTGNSLWTWRGDRPASLRLWIRRGLGYHAVALVAGAINVTGLWLLVRFLGLDYRLANLLAIGAGSLWTFLASDRWVFRRR